METLAKKTVSCKLVVEMPKCFRCGKPVWQAGCLTIALAGATSAGTLAFPVCGAPLDGYFCCWACEAQFDDDHGYTVPLWRLSARTDPQRNVSRWEERLINKDWWQPAFHQLGGCLDLAKSSQVVMDLLHYGFAKVVEPEDRADYPEAPGDDNELS